MTNTVVFDQMKFARQVGLLPRDGSVADKAFMAAFNVKTKVAIAARRRLGHSTPAASSLDSPSTWRMQRRKKPRKTL